MWESLQCFRTPKLMPFGTVTPLPPDIADFPSKKTVYSLDSSRSELVLLTSILEETTAGRNTGHIYALYFCFHVLSPFFHPLLLFEIWFSKLAGDWI